MVHGERNAVSNLITENANVVDEVLDPSWRHLKPCERMHGEFGVARVWRRNERAGHVPEQVDSDVNLEHDVAAIEPAAEFLGGLRRVCVPRSIRITEDSISMLTTGELVGGHPIRLTGKIHERHFDSAHSPTSAAMTTELFD